MSLKPPISTRWTPDGKTPTEKQAAALILQNVEELFYGGAAGGGKTDWLIWEALAYVDQPGYSAILFRSSYPNLSHEPDGLIPRMDLWLRGTGAKWAAKTRTWHFPSSATITLGFLHAPDDHHKYAGPSYQMIGFDEATEMRYRSMRFLYSRLRRLKTASHIPIRVRYASNPGGRSHAEFRDHFGLDDPEAAVRLKVQADTGYKSLYIPALMTDNPHLDQDEYLKTLMQLLPADRERLLRGDWTVLEEGGVLKREWFPVVADVPAIGRTVRYWDTAATEERGDNDPDYTVGVRVTMGPDDVYVHDLIRVRQTAGSVNSLIKRTAEHDSREVPIYIETEPGSQGKLNLVHWKRELAGWAVRGWPQSASKLGRVAAFASRAEIGDVKLVRGNWIGPFLDEAATFTGDGKLHDDQVDAVASAYNVLTRRPDWKAG